MRNSSFSILHKRHPLLDTDMNSTDTAEAVTMKVFCKKGVLRKVLRPATLWKKRLAQVFSYEFCEVSKNTFSYRTPPAVASGTEMNKLNVSHVVKFLKKIMPENQLNNWVTSSWMTFGSDVSYGKNLGEHVFTWFHIYLLQFEVYLRTTYHCEKSHFQYE